MTLSRRMRRESALRYMSGMKIRRMAVVECTFRPLGGVGVSGVLIEVCKLAVETADAFGAHGVTFCRVR